MLYIESFAHRGPLAEIVSRWVVNQPQKGDVAKLKKIINFNSYVSRIWIDVLARKLISTLHGEVPGFFAAKEKGVLKDFIAENSPCPDNPRVQDLIARYKKYPEDFYRETPYDGKVYTVPRDGRPLYVGSTRIKRFRRIAEKGSRRIIDYMYQRIRANADVLAEQRAKDLGIPKHKLITPKEVMEDEFLHAERRLLKAIRQTSIHQEFPILAIPDVAGIKLIAEGDQFEQLIESIQASPDCTLLDQEHHRGRYNAVNLKVAYKFPRKYLATQIPGDVQREIFSYRGLDGETLEEDYLKFLADAEEHVLLEIIVSDYSEFMESEIGRSMHEERVMIQRSSADYSAQLASTVAYLMEYILALCLAPTKDEISDVPIKLWVKYMPDTMDRAYRALYNLPVDASFDFPLQGAELESEGISSV